MDRYNERLIVGKASPLSILGLVGAIVLTIAGVGLFLLVPSIAILVFGGGIFLIVLAKDSFSVEYEFIITNGDIEVAKIISRKRRKTVKNIDADKIAKMDRADNDRVANDISIGKYKVTKYVGKTPGDYQIALYVGEGDNQEIFVLDLDEKCIDHLNQVIKSKSNVKL